MSDPVILTQSLLGDAGQAALDAFAAEHHGPAALPEWRVFLEREFKVDLVLDPDIVAGFAEDSSHLPHEAQGLCRPRNEYECAVILRACFQAGVPMTLSGGRSNLTGSATPEGGIVISTARLTGPEVTVDAAHKRATAPVGAILEDVRREVIAQTGGRLQFPVDPTSREDASVGGALACNASGFTPGETGAMRCWVRSLRFLLPDGSLIAAERGQYRSDEGRFMLEGPHGSTVWPIPRYPRPPVKNASGPYSAPDGQMDFVDLAIGSEGLFGLVTACELELTPRSGEFLDLFFSLPSEGDALKVLDHVRAHCNGDLSRLSAFEYFGTHCRRTMDHEDRFFHGSDPVAIYLQQPLHGQDLEEAAETWLDVLMKSGCGLDDEAILLLDTDPLRNLFLEARHSLPANALEVVQQRGTYTIMTDAVVPPDRFAEFLDYAHSLLNERGLDYVSFGHLGDCHLHFTILPEKDQLELGVQTYDDMIAYSAQCGGVYSGEHGTGKRKRRDFLRCYGEEGAEHVRRCKAAVDPDFLLNRGNVVYADNPSAAAP